MSTTRSIPTQETTTDKPPPDEFHPGKCLPDCMMPDGGECCPGYVALYDAYWHLMRSARAQYALPAGVAGKVAAARARIGAMRIAPCSGIASSKQAAKEFEEALDALSAVTSTDGAAK